MKKQLNQNTKALIELKTVFTIRKPWYKRFEIISGVFSILLAIVAILQTAQISKQKQSIENFDSLLKQQSMQINELTKLNMEAVAQTRLADINSTSLKKQADALSQQLEISGSLQKADQETTKFNSVKEFNNLYGATQLLKQLIDDHKYYNPHYEYADLLSEDYILLTSPAKSEYRGFYKEFVPQAKKIIETQLNNVFLLSNENLSKYWLFAYRRLCSINLTDDVVFTDSHWKIPALGDPWTDLPTKLKDFDEVIRALHNAFYSAKYEIRKINSSLDGKKLKTLPNSDYLSSAIQSYLDEDN